MAPPTLPLGPKAKKAKQQAPEAPSLAKKKAHPNSTVDRLALSSLEK
jgi:hypothetical protein